MCLRVCVRVTCGELSDAANISVLYTFSSFETVSIRAAAALLLHSPVVKIDARSFTAKIVAELSIHTAHLRSAHTPSALVNTGSVCQ